MTGVNPQPSSRAGVLMPVLVEGVFDYLVPEGTKAGALVEANFAHRTLVGAVWTQGGEGKEIPLEKLKPVMRVLDQLPPLSADFRQWLTRVSEFTLAPPGAVLGLCGLAYAAKTPKKPQAPQQITLNLPALTPAQTRVAATLIEDMSASQHDHAPSPILLDGVTGSGKTEVYFHAIAAAIARRAGETTLPLPQLLVLLPEIALTHQWLDRFEKTFGTAPVVWHSRMTPVARARAWQAIARGEVQVVVGARSALFLPFANLRGIILDEEHEAAYKQEEGVLYHARDMAVMRARCERIPIVLASATPSLETLENVRAGKYRVQPLTARFGAAGLPEIRLVDLRNHPPERGEFIAPIVRQDVLETLARGEQVLFFLNRRGYAPLLLCRTCGHRFQCADCSAWLVMHGSKSAKATLCCHHCGYREPLPQSCPACQADAALLAPCGPGVERILEEVSAWFVGGTPATPRIALLSSDESIPPETWAAIEAGAVDIIVGTQMVAKGHHFPKLTRVVVVDADVGLDGADLRAGERSYQLLHQLGGRAGRGALPGVVLVQSYAPDHPVMQALVAQDRDRLMAIEAKERRAGGWPPFGQLAAILLDGTDETRVRAAGQMLARAAPEDARVRVLGPAPAPLSRLRGQYRYRLLVKIQPGVHLQRTLRNWLAGKKFSGVRMKIDVNPYYFL